jgi:hypothetical protein
MTTSYPAAVYGGEWRDARVVTRSGDDDLDTIKPDVGMSANASARSNIGRMRGHRRPMRSRGLLHFGT